ncbi:MAG: hypothetical protein HQ556_14200 [Candidatus Marinimicrobia bacterium]|nr:hypothetical protein [Candidatus Neomarinimicrobiota bacterium]
MEYKITVDKELGIIKSSSSGVWNVADSNDVTKKITAASRENDIVHVLIDHSQLEINVPQAVAYNRPLELKSQFKDIYPKVAFVSPKNKHTLYKFFTLVARNRGILFRAHRTYSEASEWLLNDNL